MKWIEITIHCEKKDIDDISMILFSHGANGTNIIDRDEVIDMIRELAVTEYADDRLIPVDEYSVIAYFSMDEDLDNLLMKLKSSLADKKTLIAHQIVDDVLWKDIWKKYFRTFMISDRVKIIPEWEMKGKTIGKYDVIMDPGMAFGTGTHETTSLCAKLIDKYIRTNDTVIDVGCGSGILSIISKKLGADDVYAIDLDKAAINATKMNCQFNQTESIVTVLGELSALQSEVKADIIVANIIADIIIDLAPLFRNYLKDEGRIICSGIISSREQDVINALLTCGYTIEEIKYDNEWVAITANA
ncbi:MAG: 50S ribosomal protein L11 methyltransferase [Clostridia bacterium]|nr:50S ribosomal protein L11 methyltransferase [Clostridia bacterium]